MRCLALRVVSTLSLAVVALSCTESPTSTRRAALRVALSPQFTPQQRAIYQRLGAFGVTLDNVHVVVREEPVGGEVGRVLKDTTIAFPASATQLTIDLDLELQGSQQEVVASVDLRQATTTYFSGTQDFLAQLGETATSPEPIFLSYVGPGASAAFISISPQPATLALSGAFQFVANAYDSQERPVTDLPITWSTSDATIATVSATGLVTATAKVGAVTISANGLNGISGSATINVQSVVKLVVTQGDNQTGVAAGALSVKFTVQAVDANGNPVIGATINFATAAGQGSISPASSTTDANGSAGTTMTLGQLAGTYTFTASVSGTPAATARVAATATAAGAAALGIISGSNQADTILATLAQPLSVKVTDTFGNAVPQQPVDFQVTSGQAGLLIGGSTTPQTLVHASTDANGVAQATLRAGTLAGTITVSATAVQTTTAPVTFTTTIRPGLTKSLVVQAGNGQTAIVGTVLATALSVVVKDAGGNPTPGVAVTFTASPSSGTVSTGTTFTTSVTTNADATGTAKVSWKLGALAGIDTLTASVGALPPVLFIASGTPGPASVVSALTPADTTVNPGQQLDLMGVKVTDGVNGVDGIAVTFTALIGACTFAGGATQLSVTTADGGFASVQPVLSPNATAPSSCAVEANATNQSVPLGSPIWFKRYLVDPASTIRIFTGAGSTAWNDAKNWWKGVVPATTDVAWIPSASAVSHPALLDVPRTIASLITEGAGQLDLNKNTLTLAQNLDASAGGVVQNGTLQMNGKGALATGAIQAAFVQGTPGCGLGSSLSVGATGFLVSGTFTANCSVDATNGSLSINGPATFTGQGALFTGANSIVNFLGDVTFAGGANSLGGGVIQVTGNFQQIAPSTFAPVAATQMIFTGTNAQTITLANNQSSIPNLWIENSVGVTLNPLTTPGVLPVTNTIVLTNNSKLTFAASAQALVSIGTQGPPALVLFSGSVLTLNSNSLLRFGTPTPG
ncbi:MAG TPA: Ig-like domain-containing protein, partial [Gemmatimonadaceae bacterium]|nr:Ig-like domain-containing protein [Gemmatimonadaceae bacterium]